MKHSITTWLVILFILGALASCKKSDRQEADTQPTKGETITLKISAEVSLNNDEPQGEELKGLNFKLGEKNGKTIPMPKFEDGEEVDVHTFIRYPNSFSGGSYGYGVVAKTIKWVYRAKDNKLILKQDALGNDFVFNASIHPTGWKDFRNHNAYHITAILAPGTTLKEKSNNPYVDFEPMAMIKGIEATVGDDIGDLHIPYYLPTTELTVETSREYSASKGYRYAYANGTNKFRPLGSLIAIKLGNDLKSGNYDFTPTGFTIYSALFKDYASLNFHTAPALSREIDNLSGALTSSTNTSYTITNPEPIPHGTVSNKTYYIWVHPLGYSSEFHIYRQSSYALVTQVFVHGTSSQPETATYKDYTKFYQTDYISGRAGHRTYPIEGKVHPLVAKVRERIGLPIEYMTEYNLAGGSSYYDYTGRQEGQWGPWRFSYHKVDGSVNPNPHNNDQSGYYSVGYTIAGTFKDIDGNTITNMALHYHMPTMYEFMGVVPPKHQTLPSGKHQSYMEIYNNTRIFKVQTEYESTNLSTTPEGRCYYSINNQATSNKRSVVKVNGSSSKSEQFDHFFYPLLDDRFKTASRVTFVGQTPWNISATAQNHARIDVVYLGQEETPTQLATISNPSWWDAKKAEGKVISRTIPAPGYIENTNASRYKLAGQASIGFYQTTTRSNEWVSGGGSEGYSPRIIQFSLHDGVLGFQQKYSDHRQAHCIRIFRNNPDYKPTP